MQEEFAMILKLTFDTNTIYTVIFWAKIVFSLCLQRDLLVVIGTSDNNLEHLMKYFPQDAIGNESLQTNS